MGRKDEARTRNEGGAAVPIHFFKPARKWQNEPHDPRGEKDTKTGRRTAVRPEEGRHYQG